MTEMRTEEEQLEALKNWWKENGRSLVIGVVVAVSGVLGWQGWQGYQQKQAAEASWLFQNLANVVARELDENPDPQLETLYHLAGQLKENHAKSTYSQYAALLLARVAVQTQNYDEALAELDWVLERASESDIKVVANLRKARVLMSMGQVEQAASLLSNVNPGAFAALYFELLGDVAFKQGDLSSAITAYDQALSAAEGMPNLPVIQMKRDQLGSEAG